jgi:sulfonate transport system ATP-binding protein
VILIEEGRIGLDLTVDLPRPRRKGSVKLAELEAEVLDRVLSPPSPLSQATRRAAN